MSSNITWHMKPLASMRWKATLLFSIYRNLFYCNRILHHYKILYHNMLRNIHKIQYVIPCEALLENKFWTFAILMPNFLIIFLGEVLVNIFALDWWIFFKGILCRIEIEILPNNLFRFQNNNGIENKYKKT